MCQFVVFFFHGKILLFFDKEIGIFLEFFFPSLNLTTFFFLKLLKLSRIFYIPKKKKKTLVVRNS
jgi:hypothetical protein